MLFNSIEFLIFFPIVSVLYYLIPHKYRWIHLLLASCIFYAFFIPIYILILFLTIIIDYYAGIKIEVAPSNKKKLYLSLSIIANVGILAIFKYYNFFVENINFVFNQPFLPLLDIILPIGLSFHTFQAMSYTIEVYRGNQKAERHLGIYALYVMFYPQLVAGPIERPQNLLPQFHEKKIFIYENVVSGLRLMLWGFFKKIVIADRIAWVVDPIFNSPNKFSAFALLIGAFLFSFQIFCDFSAYSDIAIGAARTMGIKLMNNFNRPYHALSISEFWKRWHISLSTWFRDYIYITLGGNRVALPRWYFNLFIVFLISGLWHGAKWTFIIWGSLHGFYLIFGLITQSFRNKLLDISGISKIRWLNKAIQIASTFILVMFAWVFFRANSVSEALFIVKKIPFAYQNLVNFLHAGNMVVALGLDNVYKQELLYSLILIAFLESIHIFHSYKNITLFLKQQSTFIRWAAYYVLVFTIVFFGFFENRQFIYFQF
jgi:alginate O-acetyltransferase complex protein AlgI